MATRAPPLPALAIGIALLALVPLMQVVSGQISFAGDAWMATRYLMGFSFAVLGGARFVRAARFGRRGVTDSGLDPCGRAWPIVALISVGIAIHQWLDLQLLGLFIIELKHGDRPYAKFSEPNQLATLLICLHGIVWV